MGLQNVFYLFPHQSFFLWLIQKIYWPICCCFNTISLQDCPQLIFWLHFLLLLGYNIVALPTELALFSQRWFFDALVEVCQVLERISFGLGLSHIWNTRRYGLLIVPSVSVWLGAWKNVFFGFWVGCWVLVLSSGADIIVRLRLWEIRKLKLRVEFLDYFRVTLASLDSRLAILCSMELRCWSIEDAVRLLLVEVPVKYWNFLC